jgi:uncharacterized membrane protein
MKQKSVYNDQNINNVIFVILLSAMLLGFSLYLTQHFFDVKFPTGLSSGSLCNINSFFNCDKTTNSALGAPFNVPLSVFGVLIGLLTIMGLVIKNEDFESTIYFTLIINFIGCVLLFLYSLIVLHGLCPFCTLYYIASGLTLFLFYKKSESYEPNPAYLGSFAIVFIIVSVLMRMNVTDRLEEREKATSSISADLIKQYFSLPNLGDPKYPSIYKLISQNNAPIRMVIFSDFECPACKALSEEVPAIIEKYKGKIDISYYFYPLDMSCNPNMKRALHQYACKAAYAASCMPSADFYQVHELIFKNQTKLEAGEFIDDYIKQNRLESCVKSAETKDKISKIIAAAEGYNVASTPTFLLNGVKIEGALPIDQLSIILDEIIRRSGK